ncbi:hypothetical protein C8R46DRAFT_1238752 [Mycena filopes]|nr:hypothetical protein C8R46DRAFT_1238752 [Mycena filopes]
MAKTFKLLVALVLSAVLPLHALPLARGRRTSCLGSSAAGTMQSYVSGGARFSVEMGVSEINAPGSRERPPGSAGDTEDANDSTPNSIGSESSLGTCCGGDSPSAPGEGTVVNSPGDGALSDLESPSGDGRVADNITTDTSDSESKPDAAANGDVGLDSSATGFYKDASQGPPADDGDNDSLTDVGNVTYD